MVFHYAQGFIRNLPDHCRSPQPGCLPQSQQLHHLWPQVHGFFPRPPLAPHLWQHGGSGWDLCLLWSLTHSEEVFPPSQLKPLFLIKRLQGQGHTHADCADGPTPGSPLTNPAGPPRGWHPMAARPDASRPLLLGHTLHAPSFPPFSLGAHCSRKLSPLLLASRHRLQHNASLARAALGQKTDTLSILC